jgi:hypothetical protein
MIQLAWLWLRYQPGSELARWFRERVTLAGRTRRIAIVAGIVQARSKSLTTNIRIHAAELVVKPFFKTFDDIVDHCCYAWNTLIDQPWKIMSVARRDWAIVGQPI